MLAVTATATQAAQDDIRKYLFLRANTLSIGIIPDRPNIGLVSKESASEEYEEKLAWLLDWIKSASTKLDKTIIFCRLVSKLGDQAYVDGDRSVEHRVVEMFHASTTDLSKERILNEFSGEGGVKVVVATVAFGLGIDIPDIRLVVHWCAHEVICRTGRRWGGQDGMGIRPLQLSIRMAVR